MSRRRRIAVTRAERVEPTPETVAKLKPDPFPELIAAGLLPGNAKSLAEDLAEAFLLRTAGLGYGSGGPGGSGHDSLRSEALQTAWFEWARSIFKLTLVRAHVFVEWGTGQREIDRPAAVILSRGLTYWARDLDAAWKKLVPQTQSAA